MVGIIVGIAAVVVLVAIGFVVLSKRRASHRREQRRLEASDTRDRARASELEATKRGAEADERAARARREQAAAEQQRRAAEASSETAQELHAHADELDPDKADHA